MSEYFVAVLQTWTELAPWLLLGAAVAAVLHVILPSDFVRRHLRGRGSVAKAVAIGVPLPLCSCGVIPAGLGLKKDGASDAASIGFLISTPQTGVDSFMVSAAFLGWPFALFKLVAAAITGVAGGTLVGRFGRASRSLGGHPVNQVHPTDSGPLSAFVAHADDLIRSIWGWLVFGVLISAAISTWLPPGSLTAVTKAGGLATMLAVLGLSLPLYICATASVPIAAALVAGGLPSGAALVFLMAGPATNIATMGAIFRAFGGRVLGLYLAATVGGSVGLGLLFDAWFPLGADAVSGVHEMQPGAGAYVAALVLASLVARYALADARRWYAGRSATEPSPTDFVIEVGGLTCGGCVARLEAALRANPSIARAVVHLHPGQAVVSGVADEASVREIIESTGFVAGPSSPASA